MQEDIERLLMEIQRARFTERRTEVRKPFVRPVKINVGREPGIDGFSRDMSKMGIGIVMPEELSEHTQATLTIHSTTSDPVYVVGELCWTTKFGTGWFLTGWKFIRSTHRPEM